MAKNPLLDRLPARMLAAVGLTLSLSATGCLASARPYSEREDLQAFIMEMSAKHAFDRQRLTELFSLAQHQPGIIAAISSPAEAKPWHQYRPIFVNRARIEGGLTFWDANNDLLAQAEQRFGVPAQVIIAIIGVETRYGRHTGTYRVLDSLTTLAFDYPPRSRFFRSELEHYLLLTREEGIDPLEVKGSYAGAMGHPQFISSSYRRYAVDFDGDGHRDIWNSSADAIGSVANYLATHGWRAGEPVASRARVQGTVDEDLVNAGLKPRFTVRRLKGSGVEPNDNLEDQALASLIVLEAAKGTEYWVGLQNFYTITRYNHSALYAMAVYQLSQEILARHKARVSRH